MLETVPFTRRQFLSRTGLGGVALAWLLNYESVPGQERAGGLPGLPHFEPRIRRVIYLFQSGAPSQLDLFDHKPTLDAVHGTELPGSIRMGQRITTMTSGQT